MVQLEEPILRRIYLARQMLNEGVIHSQDPSPLARMRAVLALDHAIEMLLSTLLPLLGISVDRNWSLSTMVGKFCEKKPAISPHKTPIERLRCSNGWGTSGGFLWRCASRSHRI